MAFFTSFLGRFGRGGVALSERTGKQDSLPAAALVDDLPMMGPDAALQISTVWNCIDRRAMAIASLPFFVYEQLANGQKELARNTRLYQLLHDSPNSRMTPLEFWRAMMMNHDLRGNAYARIDRDASTQEAVALWPMPADQVQHAVLDDGTSIYEYRIGNDMAILSADNVLHIKNLGNGTTGLSKLDFMRVSLSEARNAQAAANKVFASGGKPSGVLMVDKVLTDEQRLALKKNFAEMSDGNTSRLFVLEASMKYQQISFTPEQLELLKTRGYIVEEICRWFDVPPVLVHHSNVTTWGSGVEQIVDGWHKLSVRPMLVNIEQAVKKRVFTARQRATLSMEINQDALLRGSLKDRAEIYAKQTQNGIMTRNEARQLENLPPDPSPTANTLTVQTNLVPIDMLGQTTNGAPNAAF